MTAVDIDRDGDQDLVIVIGDDLILRRNDGQANFGAAETILAGMAGWPAFGDFNGDNRTDVAVALGTPGVAVALANASGGFLAPVVYAVAGGAHGLADPADLNGDGRLDLFIIAGDDNGPSAGRERCVRRWRRRFRRRGPGHHRLRVLADAGGRERRRPARSRRHLQPGQLRRVARERRRHASRRRCNSRTPSTTVRPWAT